MEMTIDQIASQVQGRIQGDGQKCITGVAPFEIARQVATSPLREAPNFSSGSMTPRPVQF